MAATTSTKVAPVTSAGGMIPLRGVRPTMNAVQFDEGPGVLLLLEAVSATIGQLPILNDELRGTAGIYKSAVVGRNENRRAQAI